MSLSLSFITEATKAAKVLTTLTPETVTAGAQALTALKTAAVAKVTAVSQAAGFGLTSETVAAGAQALTALKTAAVTTAVSPAAGFGFTTETVSAAASVLKTAAATKATTATGAATAKLAGSSAATASAGGFLGPVQALIAKAGIGGVATIPAEFLACGLATTSIAIGYGIKTAVQKFATKRFAKAVGSDIWTKLSRIDFSQLQKINLNKAAAGKIQPKIKTPEAQKSLEEFLGIVRKLQEKGIKSGFNFNRLKNLKPKNFKQYA